LNSVSKKRKREIGLLILKLRTELQLSQNEFCAEFNNLPPTDLQIDRTMLSKYENGRSMPSADRMIKILSMKG